MSDSKELKKRVLTGLIGGAVFVAWIIYAGHVGAAILGAVLAIGMLYEYCGMVFRLSDQAEKTWILLGAGWLVHFISFWMPLAAFGLMIMATLGLFAYYLFTADRHGEAGLAAHLSELAWSFFGLFYLGFFMLFFAALRDGMDGAKWMLLFLFMVWAGDTGAYFAGRKWGKTKLYPLISPKKTREGALGGILAGLLVAILFKLTAFSSLSWLGALFIPLAIGVTAPVGDLCESFIKRAFDKKDSGSLLPGHGGLLDRFDSVVFSLPIMYACMRVFS